MCCNKRYESLQLRLINQKQIQCDGLQYFAEIGRHRIWLIIWLCIVGDCCCQEALTQWMTGRASHYGVVNNAALLPELSCGFVQSQPSFDSYPFGNIGSISLLNNISLTHQQQGCGACLEIKCTSLNCNPQTTKKITVYDICSARSNSVQCEPNGIVLPAYVFQEFAPFQMGILDIQFRQVECQVDTNITLIVDNYLRGSAAYINIRFRDVAGDGSISSVELRQTALGTNEDLNNNWIQMNRFGDIGFDFSGVPEPPLDFRITGAAGQVAVLRSIITQNTGMGEYDTQTQFKTGPFLTRIPMISDFPNTQVGAGNSQCSCVDNTPAGAAEFSCDEQKLYGRCQEPYMIERGWCALTCGRCTCPQPQQTTTTTPTNSPPTTYEIPNQYYEIAPNPPPPSMPLLAKEQNILVDPPLLAVQFPQGIKQSSVCPLSLDGLISSSPDLKMFYEAITASRISENLKDPHLALTMFAPNNYAFKLFVDKIGIDWETLKLNYPGILQRIILYQIIPGIWDVGRLQAAGHGIKNPVEIITLLPYSSVNISATSSSSLMLGGPINFADSIWVDLSICESILHYVDQVVIPFTDFTLNQLFKFEPVTNLPFGINNTVVDTPESEITVEDLRINALVNPIKLIVGNNSNKSTNNNNNQFYSDNININNNNFQSNSNSSFDPYSMNEVIKPQLSDVSSIVVTTYQELQQNNNQDQNSYQNNQQIQTVYTFTSDPQTMMQNQYGDNSQADLGFSDLTQICPSVFQIVERNPNLGVFEQFIIAAKYDQILNDAQRTFTVFAPTDDAFRQLLASQNATLDMVLSRPNELKILLGYHIVSGLYSLDELRILALSPNAQSTLNTYTQFNQQTVQIELKQSSDGDIFIQGVGSNATIEKQVRSCESVVHIINNVLLPFKPEVNSPQQQQQQQQNLQQYQYGSRPQMALPSLQYTVYNTEADMQVVGQNQVQRTNQINSSMLQSPSQYQIQQFRSGSTNSNVQLQQQQQQQSPGQLVLQSQQQITAPLGILSPTVAALECKSMQAFFGERGAGQADLRYFQILIDVTFFRDSLYYTREKINLFAPTNEGIEKGLKILNATFSSLLIDTVSSESLVQYHVVSSESTLEDLALKPVTQTINMPTALKGYDVQFQPDDFTTAGTLVGVTSYLTHANILERVQTCSGIVYVIDTLLLPQGIQIKG